MQLYSLVPLKRLCLAALIPCFVACGSAAPGLHFDPSTAALETEPGDTSGSYTKTSSAEAGGAQAGSEGLKPVLKPITPRLVKAERELRAKQSSQDISALLSKSTRYKIDSGDVLSIVVWDHPELTNSATGIAGVNTTADTNANMQPQAGFPVDDEGRIQFPFAPNLKVAGLTEDEARNLLGSKLAKYIRNPKITLRVQSYRSKRVYVDGEVKNPGLQAINDIPMSLMEAINRAGGILPSGDQSRIVVIRDGKNYDINLLQLVQRGVNPSSIMLKNGDVVKIRSRDESKIFVSGEVVQPRALTMHDGRLTLNEALGEAGGVNPLSGDGGQIYVIRHQGSQQVVYQLDGRSPGALAMAEGFELSPKDVVYVAATPLANWHRAISLILPSALSGAVGAVTPVTTPR
jgi:polysaccharide export outer membrane protein